MIPVQGYHGQKVAVLGLGRSGLATAIALAGTGLTVMSQQALEWANTIDNDNVAAAWAGLMLFISIFATIGILWLLPVKDEQQV